MNTFDYLSPREQQVLVELMHGFTAQQISERHVTSLSTVRSQIHAILQKLGVRSQAQAIVLAYEFGWIPDDDLRTPSRFASVH
jgi:DNA-binding NarL/FixJ family response regulator